MDLIAPEDIYWYSCGDYDHLADLAIAHLGDRGEGALNLLNVELVSPEDGERAFVIGYPKAKSRVFYNVPDSVSEVLGALDGAPVGHVFYWDSATVGGLCTKEWTPIRLGEISFVSDMGDPDGMSGSPMFVMRGRKLALGGILVRANADKGLFLSGEELKWQLARNLARYQSVTNRVLSLTETAIVNGRLVSDGSPGARIMDRVRAYVSGTFGGDIELTRQVFLDWPTSGKALADLVFERAQDHVAQRHGKEIEDVWKYIRNWRRLQSEKGEPEK